MKKYSKRIGSLALALMMAFSYVPAVFAEELEAQTLETAELGVDSPAAVSVDVENIEPVDVQDYTGWDTIKVFETTDIHGYITDVSTYKEETFQYRLAYIANVVNQARINKEEYKDVLLLDSGDIYQSTPHSNLTHGAALRAAMDKMGYDAVGMGNHEFDWDVTQYAADEKDGTMASYNIGAYQGDPAIPVLMSNLYYAGTDTRVNFTQDYTVVEKGGYKIAILGWAEDYSSEIKASQIAPYKIDGSLDNLKEKAAAVKEETAADVLVILAHSDPVPIADAMDPDVVDLVAGGHTHRQVNGTSKITQIDYIQGYNKAYGYSTAEIKINPETKEVDVIDPRYVDIAPRGADLSYLYYNEDNDQLDPEIVKISQAAWDAVKDEMYEVLCSVKQDISRSYIDESNATTSVAGNWLSELMLAATKDQNTIAAFTNRGGIRTDLNLAADAEKRDITVADIYTITPFGNRILTYDVTGRQMARQLEKALTGLNPAIGNNNGYLDSNYGDQFAGITITYKPVEGGIEVTSIVTNDGEIIDINDNTKTYRICINEYCATLAGSVFTEDGLEPVVALEDAPADNLSAIAALREHREAVGLEMELDTSVHAMTVENKIAELKEVVEKYDEATVTAADKDVLVKKSAEIEAMIGSGKLTEDESSSLKTIKTEIEKLLAKIAATEDPSENDPVKPDDQTNNRPGSKPDNKTNSNLNGKENNTVKTGDTSEVMPWMVLLLVSGTGIFGVAEAARRKQKRG